MRTKQTSLSKAICTFALLVVFSTVNAQIKYDSNGRLTIGNTTPYGTYSHTIAGTGVYLRAKTSNFFQIDVTPAATRLASHYDQVVFYNTQSSVYNSIQVKNVYNYSDARAKSNIQSLNDGLNYILKLRPVSYNFTDKADRSMFKTGGSGQEMGLLAQEVEAVLPNIVLTDPDGKKLINYTAIIPIMIDAIKTLQQEISELKAAK